MAWRRTDARTSEEEKQKDRGRLQSGSTVASVWFVVRKSRERKEGRREGRVD